MSLENPRVTNELHLVQRTKFSLNGNEYLFFIRAQDNLLVAASSSMEIKVYDSESLHFRGTMKGHLGPITSMEWVHGLPGHLVTASEDGTAAIWDAIQGKLVAHVKNKHGEKLYSAACNGTHLVAGGEGDIYFFDLKRQTQVGAITEMHSEAVTQLHFHPKFPNTQLFSASLDGTINLYDLNVQNPDDSLQSTMFSKQPVRRLGFFGPNLSMMYCISDVETLTMFDLNDEEANSLGEFDDARERCSIPGSGVLVNYLVGGCSAPSSPAALLLASGTFKGTLVLSVVEGDAITPAQVLDGHEALIRDVTWHNGRVYSVDEAATICVWAKQQLKQPEHGTALKGAMERKKGVGFQPY